MLYMITFTINIPPMLAYIPAPWILWVRGGDSCFSMFDPVRHHYRCVTDLGRKLIHDVLSHGEKTVLSWWLPYTFYVSGPDKDWWLPVSTLTGEIRMNFGVRISSDHYKIKSDTIKFKMIHYSTIVQHHEIIKNSQHRHYNMDHFTSWEA